MVGDWHHSPASIVISFCFVFFLVRVSGGKLFNKTYKSNFAGLLHLHSKNVKGWEAKKFGKRWLYWWLKMSTSLLVWMEKTKIRQSNRDFNLYLSYSFSFCSWHLFSCFPCIGTQSKQPFLCCFVHWFAEIHCCTVFFYFLGSPDQCQSTSNHKSRTSNWDEQMNPKVDLSHRCFGKRS